MNIFEKIYSLLEQVEPRDKAIEIQELVDKIEDSVKDALRKLQG